MVFTAPNIKGAPGGRGEYSLIIPVPQKKLRGSAMRDDAASVDMSFRPVPQRPQQLLMMLARRCIAKSPSLCP